MNKAGNISIRLLEWASTKGTDYGLVKPSQVHEGIRGLVSTREIEAGNLQFESSLLLSPSGNASLDAGINLLMEASYSTVMMAASPHVNP